MSVPRVFDDAFGESGTARKSPMPTKVERRELSELLMNGFCPCMKQRAKADNTLNTFICKNKGLRVLSWIIVYDMMKNVKRMEYKDGDYYS